MTQSRRKEKMFISLLPNQQVEVALTREGMIIEYYVEMLNQAKTKGNIYKGYIHNIDPALQAAFINYGAERNGFLQIDEIHPEYFSDHRLKKGHRFPLIQNVLKPGQEIYVQVVKEPTGKKGAFLTTYLSIPGRCIVLTPGREQVGVSRKIEHPAERARLKKTIESFKTEEGVGLILRTASKGCSKSILKADLRFLNRLWLDIKIKGSEVQAPACTYEEMGLAGRSVRDYLSSEVSEIWVDDESIAEEVTKFSKLAYPRRSNLVKIHKDPNRTLWERFNLVRQIMQISEREVTLPSGGRLVIDQTEALTAIDINSGKIGGERNFNEMALKTNLESAEAIARQLKLRDLGGQIVVDFIEMKNPKNCKEVEKVMRAALKNDRARTDMSRISRFGLMEIVRQRLGSSAIAISTEPCPHCKGTGSRRNLEWQAVQGLKTIYRALRIRERTDVYEHELEAEVALYLLNHKRDTLRYFEERFDTKIEIVVAQNEDE